MSSEEQRHQSLNPYQANRLRITCHYIDKLLSEIEEILNATASQAAFPRYSPDILPAQRRTITDYIARVRAQLIRVLEGQRIELEKPSIPASRAVHVNLGAIEIAVEELKPRYMLGYGEIPEAVATELNGIVGELSGLVRRFDRYLCEGVGEDLKLRLERLGSAENGLARLQKVEQVVRDRGLVEFRGSIASILDRAEDKSFEIAVFGRVSAGKSSLLNAVLETDALPVGVTPITAVPTRIVHGEAGYVTVWFSEAPKKEFGISHLAEFATEQQNSGNVKRVVRVVLALPSPRLREGVAFVDTPGLGSLAAGGAAETLAYLPKCDLGVILIDAGATITADDLQTIMALQEAAIPVNILLSKADLLGPEDRKRVIEYTKQNIFAECRLDVSVHPVSGLPAYRAMLDDWFESEIVPLYGRAQELRAASLRRKIGALADSVIASLEARLKWGAHSPEKLADSAREAEDRLRKATGQIEETGSRCQQFIQQVAGSPPDVIEEAARRALLAWETVAGVEVPMEALVRESIVQSVQALAGQIQSEMSVLATEIGRCLKQCAASLNVSDSPSEEEFCSLIRGVPVFELPSFNVIVSRPRFAALLGPRLAAGSIARQISRQVQSPLGVALDAYWRAVAAWCDSLIGQLRHQFETYAEPYRAQAEGMLADQNLTKEECDQLTRSLAELKTEGGTRSEHLAASH